MPSDPTKRRVLRLPRRLIRADTARDGSPDNLRLLADRYVLAHALDPVRVMRAAGLTPDRWQLRLLRSASRRRLILCSRQSGKSTTAAAMAVSEAFAGATALVLLLSPTMRQSLELFRKVRDMLASLQHIPPLRRDSGNMIEFVNGSRIVSLPGEEGNIRGYSHASHIFIDEAARVADELYRAIRPMLAVSNGRMTCLSTPWREDGWFYEAWSGGGTEWDRTNVTAVECPRISPEFLDEEQRELGPAAFAREYMCEFTGGAYRVFDPGLVRAAFVSSVAPLFSNGEI